MKVYNLYDLYIVGDSMVSIVLSTDDGRYDDNWVQSKNSTYLWNMDYLVVSS